MSLQLATAVMGLYTGPVDDLELRDSSQLCPACGASLSFVPLQSGCCHSGRFATRVTREHFWCDECAEVYVDSTEG
jgi:hypothetical protein